jgi:hypothetical protein
MLFLILAGSIQKGAFLRGQARFNRKCIHEGNRPTDPLFSNDKYINWQSNLYLHIYTKEIDIIGFPELTLDKIKKNCIEFFS